VEADLKLLEKELGHSFANADLLVCALTHRSLAHERAQAEGSRSAVSDNERLEFLGDAVLSLVVAEALFALHPDWREGAMTRVRSGLVSRQHMAQVAETIGLGRHLRLSRGEEHSGLRRRSTVLSNTMEAVMGALFLDGGLEPVRAFVRRRVMGEAADRLAFELTSGDALGNYKSALQERLQAERAGAPVYRVKSESGPDHHKRFLVEVRLRSEAGKAGEPLARGMGRTKKLAEQDAARRALQRLAGGNESNAPVDLEDEERPAQ
jgi:ribonuclease III